MDCPISDNILQRPSFVSANAPLKRVEKLFNADPKAELLIVSSTDEPLGVILRNAFYEALYRRDMDKSPTLHLGDLMHIPPKIYSDSNITLIRQALIPAHAAGGAFVISAQKYKGWISFSDLLSITHNAESAPSQTTTTNTTKTDDHLILNQYFSYLKSQLSNARQRTWLLEKENDPKLKKSHLSDLKTLLQEIDHQILGAGYLYPKLTESNRVFTPDDLCSYLQTSWSEGDGTLRRRPAIRYTGDHVGINLPNASLVRFAIELAIEYLLQVFPSQRQIVNLHLDQNRLSVQIKLRGQSSKINGLGKVIDAISTHQKSARDLLISHGVHLTNIAQILDLTGARTQPPLTKGQTWSFEFPAHVQPIITSSELFKVSNMQRVNILIASADAGEFDNLSKQITALDWFVDSATNLVELGVKARQTPYQLIVCDLDAFGNFENGLQQIIRQANKVNAMTPIIGLTNGLNIIADRSIVPTAVFTRPINSGELVYAMLDALMEQGKHSLNKKDIEHYLTA